jgi:flagellar biosynthetic protein FlhB
MSQERTEKPTGKRLSDARKKGQVPRSHDLVAALAMLAVSVALTRTGSAGMSRIEAQLRLSLAHLGDRARAPFAPHDLWPLISQDLMVLLVVTGPFLATAAVVAVAANVAQSGWVYAPTRLTPDFSRLSPATGLSRLKPTQAGLDLVKTLITGAVITVLAYRGIHAVMLEGPRLAWMAPAVAASDGWSRLIGLMQQAGFALLAIALADYGLQRWRFMQSLRMTKQEVKDEARLNEGNPEIKGRVKRIQREMHRRRMLQNVKKATVIVTNPTHVAVALEYHRATMAAPVVVAKGQELLAQKIKEIGREHGIPMVENVSLARALFATAEVGEPIPADLFGAVAEVLAYLVRIKQLML